MKICLVVFSLLFVSLVCAKADVTGTLTGGTVTVNGVTQPIQTWLGSSSSAASASGVNFFSAARNMAGFLASATPTVCIVGDSTTLYADNITPMDLIGARVYNHLRDAYPDKTITWKDFSIGGTTMTQFGSTGAVIGGSLPSWFSNTANTWSSYVAAAGCTSLFTNWGVNSPGYDSAAGYASLYALIVGYTPIPDIVHLTNKIANPDAGAPYNQTAYQYGYIANMNLAETIARSGLNLGATNLPPVGVIGIGRFQSMVVYGQDPKIQALKYIVNPSSPITGIVPNASTPYALPLSPGGDFDLSFTLTNGAAWTGTTQIVVITANAVGQVQDIAIVPNGANSGQACYENLYYGNGGANIQKDVIAWHNTSASNTIRIAAKRGHIQTWCNGVAGQDAVVPRSFGPFIPTIGFTAPPAGETMTINSYAVGIPRPTTPILSRADCYGSSGGTYSGNGINHDSSLCLNYIDEAVLDAVQWR